MGLRQFSGGAMQLRSPCRYYGVEFACALLWLAVPLWELLQAAGIVVLEVVGLARFERVVQVGGCCVRWQVDGVRVPDPYPLRLPGPAVRELLPFLDVEVAGLLVRDGVVRFDEHANRPRRVGIGGVGVVAFDRVVRDRWVEVNAVAFSIGAYVSVQGFVPGWDRFGCCMGEEGRG